MHLPEIRKTHFVLILVAFFIFRAMAIYAQPEEILLEHQPEVDSRERPPVLFPHEKHMDIYGCLDCHHAYDKGENVLDEGDLEDGSPAAQCVTCHDFKNNCSIQRLFHKQCLGCHVKKGKTNEKKGPRQCNGCHVPLGKSKILHFKQK